MKAVQSTVFRTICFPHKEKIIIVDQLDFYTPNTGPNTDSNVSLIVDSSIKYETVRVGLFKDSHLMGIFASPPPDPP